MLITHEQCLVLRHFFVQENRSETNGERNFIPEQKNGTDRKLKKGAKEEHCRRNKELTHES
ncbi:CLUMA_CG019925, isoform A [Clunio marinus]|uniref:CLUMA_CG019925, isoform A n=1 Tax=Clunio marinus TaxID=568069 RepID=A0A1J1J508_9DIPT|nr:CLUMA_CG019925, isoform A [Clunio marinus]